jgi:hypothetical protein
MESTRSRRLWPSTSYQRRLRFSLCAQTVYILASADLSPATSPKSRTTVSLQIRWLRNWSSRHTRAFSRRCRRVRTSDEHFQREFCVRHLDGREIWVCEWGWRSA